MLLQIPTQIRTRSAAVIPLLLALFCVCGSRDLRCGESVIAGGPDVFVEVRHIVLRGSNFDIGRQIAAVAMNDGIEIVKTPDVLLNRAKRKYMARNYPILYERMKGVASAYGLSIEDDSYDFTRLSQVTKGSPGCSVAFYPGKY
jgi:hypothetical protein